MPSIAGWAARAGPAGSPRSTFSAPAGTPASCSSSTTRTPEREVVGDGLKTTVLPGQQRRRDRPAEQGQREVERRDHREHAVRPQHALVALAARAVRQPDDVRLVGLDLAAVLGEEVDGLLGLADRLDPVLADLEGHDGAELVDVGRDQLGGPADDRHPLGELPRGPLGLGPVGRGDGGLDVVAARRGEPGEHHVEVAGREHRDGRGPLPGPALDDRAQHRRLGAHGLGRGLEALVRGLAGERGRDVRDLRLAGHQATSSETISANTPTTWSTSSSECCTDSVHCSSRPGVM